MIRKKLLATCLGAAFALILFAGGAAAAYPDKPIKLVVPFAAGGTTDAIARVVAAQLGARLGQPVLVDNRPGAGSALGAEVVAKSPADGYTLLFAPSDVVILSALRRQVPYDPVNSFAPVARVATSPLVIAAGTRFAASTPGELIAIAKAHPGSVRYGSPGIGSIAHLVGELFAMEHALSLTHVPYRGGAPAVTDLIGNQIELAIAGPADFAKRAEAGQLKMLVQTGAARHSLIRQVPTLAESIKGTLVMSWFGVLAPAGTPPATLGRLTRELLAIASMPDVDQRLVDIGCDSAPLDAAAFGQFIAAERSTWTKVVTEARIPLQD